MRILHLGKFYPPAPGGMERFLADLVHAQREAGHEVAVLVHDDPRPRTAPDPAWLWRVPVWLRLLFAPISPAYPLWLHRAIRRFQPDVIHIHVPNLSAFWALLLPASRALPWVVHWHSDIELSKLSLRATYPHYRMLERALLERAECVIATSAAYLEASAPLAAVRPKCHVVPLGVDPARLPEVDAREAAPLWTGEGLRLLAVGRLTYYKGFETLLRAVAAEPGMQLVVVGEGEERPALERLLREVGDPLSIHLAGEVDDEALHRYMASCDVFCLPSRERTEAFGIVLMEAMRYGKPIVASDIPGSGVTWVARHNQNAVLVPIGDVAAWREALAALARSPRRRELLGRLGHERYAREFDVASVARRIEEIYTMAIRVQVDDAGPATVAGWLDASNHVEHNEPGEDALGFDRLLVVIPALNEAQDIGGVIEQVREQGLFDVLVVDDGSTDDTAAVAMLSGATVIRAPLWQGAWGAIQTGIRYAVRHGYSGVVTMDADGQHEPAYLQQLVEAARAADVVIAACPSRGSRMRHIAWSYFKMITGFDFDDLTSGFRYYNAPACRLLAAEEATLLDYQDVGVLLLLHHARFRIAEIPVAMNPRRHGASRVFSSWWTVARYMAETSLLCLARWNQPLRAKALARTPR